MRRLNLAGKERGENNLALSQPVWKESNGSSTPRAVKLPAYNNNRCQDNLDFSRLRDYLRFQKS